MGYLFVMYNAQVMMQLMIMLQQKAMSIKRAENSRPLANEKIQTIPLSILKSLTITIPGNGTTEDHRILSIQDPLFTGLDPNRVEVSVRCNDYERSLQGIFLLGSAYVLGITGSNLNVVLFLKNISPTAKNRTIPQDVIVYFRITILHFYRDRAIRTTRDTRAVERIADSRSD